MTRCTRLLFALPLLFVAAPSAHAQTPELLPPAEAFRLEARVDGDTLLLDYRIEPGYYLYGDRFGVETDTAGALLGAAAVPPGEVKDDPWFGRVETHRDAVGLRVPIEFAAERPGSLRVAATSQGCADIGVCFPPYTHDVAVAVPAAAGDGGLLSRVGALTGLASLLGGAGEQRFLPPDEAFRPRLELAGDRLELHFEIAPDYYLYRDKLGAVPREPSGATLGALALPDGEPKHDEYFGEVEVYYGGVVGRAALDGVAPGESLSVEVAFQGCADAGLCYPPMTRLLELVVPAAAAADVAPPAPAAAVMVAEQDRIAATLASGGLGVIALTFFGFGLLLAFTPCVFPMVPILSAMIVGHGEGLGTRRAFALSLVYVLGMALTYTAAGVLAGLFGASANLQAAFQDPWVLSAFAALFVLLALSMFGFYELQLPSAWQTRLAKVSSRQRGGTYAGAAVMGVLSALIVGPCVAAPLAGALIYIGNTGDAAVGGTALFALAMGMGTPLLAIGASAGRLIPRAGAWMQTVKAVFGVLLLAVAIYLLERIVPTWVALLAWAALLMVTAIYMGALDSLQPGASGWRRLWKGTGLVMLVYGVLLMVGAAGGGHDPLQPLRGVAVAGGGTAAERGLDFQPVKGVDGLQAALLRADAENRHVLLDFYADWCISCKEMERYTFSDPAVRASLAGTVLLQTDVTANDAADQALLEHFGLYGPPAVLFFGPDGVERSAFRLVGFVDAERFRRHVEAAQADAGLATGGARTAIARVGSDP